MTDPLSISAGAFGLAQLAFKLGTELAELIQNAANIDRTIHDLQSGVKQVEDVCSLIDKHVKRLPRPDLLEESDEEELFTGIDAHISACNSAIYKINSKIERVRRGGGRAVRQIRLNMNKEEIDSCKNQIQSGILNLQLSLQLITLQATYLIPKVANQALMKKLDEIQEAVNTQGVDTRLRDCASSYIDRGNTLYASITSSAGTIRQEPRPTEIAEWLGQIDALKPPDEFSPTMSTDDDSGISLLQTSGSEETPATPFTPQKLSLLQPITYNDDDDDDEFAMDMVEFALESGRKAYDNAQYQEAEGRLRESLNLIGKLPERQRQSYDIEEIHLLLALCAFNLHGSNAAEAALLSALERGTASDKHAKLQFEAATALSIVYVHFRKYEPAAITCENVYRGRRKLLGKDDHLCYESLALLAVIHELNGLYARARTFRSMIPIDKENELVEKYFRQARSRPASLGSTPIQKASESKNDWFSLDCDLSCLAISAAGETIACAYLSTGTRNNLIDIRSTRNCQVVHVLTVEDDTHATCLSFDSKGQRLASGHGGFWRNSFGKKFRPLYIYIWDTVAGKLLHRLNHSEIQCNLRMLSLRYTPNDEQLISTYEHDKMHGTTRDRTKPGCTVFNCRTHEILWSHDIKDCEILDISKDSGLVALYETDAAIVRSLKDYSKVRRPIKDNYIRFAPDNGLASPRKDGCIMKSLGDGASQTWLQFLMLEHERDISPDIRRLRFMPDGNALVVFMTERRDCLYLVAPQLNQWKALREEVKGTKIFSPVCSESGEYVVYRRLRDRKPEIKIVDVMEQLKSGKNMVPSMDFNALIQNHEPSGG